MYDHIAVLRAREKLDLMQVIGSVMSGGSDEAFEDRKQLQVSLAQIGYANDEATLAAIVEAASRKG